MFTTKPAVNCGLGDAKSVRGARLAAKKVHQFFDCAFCIHALDYRYSYLRVNRNTYLRGYRQAPMVLGMKSTIQSRLKEARIAAGLTQAQLAELVGMRQPTYSQLERGLSKSSTLLPQIAFVLGVQPHWLATGDGPRDEASLLDIDERELIAAWRTLPPDSKALLLTQFRALRTQLA